MGAWGSLLLLDELNSARRHVRIFKLRTRTIDMRGIIWQTKRFEFEDEEKSNRPPGIKKLSEMSKGRKIFTDVVCIWLCIEKDDKDNYINSLLLRFRELNQKFYKSEKVLILPFAHMSNNLEEPARAKEVLDKAVNMFKEKGFLTDRASFGTHKNVLWEIGGSIAEASYFEFP